MHDDVNCPYCGAGQEICHDDGRGYEEDRNHEQECGECEKIFVFNTHISFSYTAQKADCLNGSEHKYKPTGTYPCEYTRMRCIDCDHERPCTEDEMTQVLSA